MAASDPDASAPSSWGMPPTSAPCSPICVWPRGLSLREVEEATGEAVSNAYLSQLENGRIKKPSPNVLHSLAEVYAVPYEALMEKAGYLLPPENDGGRRKRSATFAIDDLTAEEEEEFLKYLRWRTR
jgi:transcriptional regulator with XRE-family HTH domain